jgi:hypothetical protein
MSFRPALGPIQPPIQRVPGALSSVVKRSGREADHSPPTSAEVKKMWVYTSIHKPSWCSAYLVKYRDNFTFTYSWTLFHQRVFILFHLCASKQEFKGITQQLTTCHFVTLWTTDAEFKWCNFMSASPSLFRIQRSTPQHMLPSMMPQKDHHHQHSFESLPCNRP